MVLVETLAVGGFQCNCAILGCPEEKKAVVVDPGGDPEKILEIVRHYDLEVLALVHTHAHLDHIAATRDIKEATGASIWLHPGDDWLYENFAMQAMMFGWKVRDVLPVDASLQDGKAIVFGKQQLDVIHTPGHTPGSVCFHHPKDALLLAGDTLFREGIGRTDLWGGSYPQIERSIREKLYALPDDTRVVCGHGPDTRIGEEKSENPFVRAV